MPRYAILRTLKLPLTCNNIREYEGSATRATAPSPHYWGRPNAQRPRPGTRSGARDGFAAPPALTSVASAANVTAVIAGPGDGLYWLSQPQHSYVLVVTTTST